MRSWGGTVYPAIEQAVEGRIIDSTGVLLPLDRSIWQKYPAAESVLLLQDERKNAN
jgi:hypothetical protein